MKNQGVSGRNQKRLRTHTPFPELKPQGLGVGAGGQSHTREGGREASWTGRSAAGTRLAGRAVRHRVCPPPQLSPGPPRFSCGCLLSSLRYRCFVPSAYWQWVTLGWNLSNCWGWKLAEVVQACNLSISVKGPTAPTDVSLEKLGKERLAWDSA